MANDPWKIIAPTCCPLVLLPTSPVFREEEVEAAPPLIPGVAAVGVVVALLSGGRKPVADIGTTSKNCFWKKYNNFFCVSHH